ncbi:RICIN domain-containing protein [Micromonospora sp. NPDC047707]|uniref:RICIN domain-containing protein n=1 Tax=Micromonospora sp. NPDC047707 TaxID=3154498 RepID=UPI0034528130
MVPAPLLRDGVGLYPRAIRLAHSGSANGRVIASVVTFAGNNGRGAIYESRDDGASFTLIGTVADAAASNGRGLCCASIYELPAPVGRLPAGTLLWAGSVGADTPNRRMQTRISASFDHGRTWSYLTTVATAGNDRGMWEPELTMSSNGQLVCIFSDETQQPRHSQTLVRSVSSDGVNWSTPTNVVALADPSARPGMAMIRRLPNRTYYMTYEICGPNHGCAVYYRTSIDGIGWGVPANAGTRVRTATGRYFAHTPSITWIDNGTPNGRIALVGQILRRPDGSVAPENGNAVFLNTENGTGPWYEIPAPVAVPNPFNNYCPNYSSALLPTASGTALLEIATNYAADGVCKPYYATGPSVGSGTADGIRSGALYRLIGVGGGNCLDVSADSRSPGGNIQVWTCNRLGPQDFLFRASQSGTFTLRGRNSGLCVGVTGGSTAPGANVAQYPCDSSRGQNWRVVGVGRGYYTLVNQGSGHCLDVAGGSRLPGANVQQWLCNSLSPQIWYADPR